MTLEQRAQQFWSLLVFAAREQKLISYSMLAQVTGYFEDPRARLVLHLLLLPAPRFPAAERDRS